MTKDEQTTLAALALVGLAAAYVMLREDAIKPRSGFDAGVPGTGQAPPPGGAQAPSEAPRPAPSVLERVGETINAWFDTLTGTGEGAAPSSEPATTPYKSPAQWRTELRPLFRRIETSFAMPTGLLEAVADRESRFRHDIITGSVTGGIGEQGIMQLHPAYHLTAPERLNPSIAIPYAGKYLAKQFLKFGTWEEALAAYNWGPGNLTTKGLINAPASTKEYIAWVKGRHYVEDFV